MEDVLPEGILEDLRNHFYAGVKAAEMGFVYNAADEDAVTGALGQALLTRGYRRVEDSGRSYIWRALHFKFGGRGTGAPEGWIGADGIFELQFLNSDGSLVRRKALLFQAKKEWRGANRRLLHQAEQMAALSPSAIVVDYRHSGYIGVSASDVIEARGNRRDLRRESALPLAEVLGDQFVRCLRGDVGVFWNPQSHSLESDAGITIQRRVQPSHLMETIVQQVR